MSPSRESGTATSVDQICVPSGLMARDAHSACFLADQSESICSAVSADSKDRHLCDSATLRAWRTLSLIVFSVPENLRQVSSRRDICAEDGRMPQRTL